MYIFTCALFLNSLFGLNIDNVPHQVFRKFFLAILLIDNAIPIFLEEPQRLGQLRILVEVKVVEEEEEVLAADRLHLVLGLLLHVLEQRAKNISRGGVVTNLYYDVSNSQNQQYRRFKDRKPELRAHGSSSYQLSSRSV